MACLTALRQTELVKKINRFISTVPYIGLNCLLIAVSNVLSAELLAYTLLIAIAVYVCLFADDLLGLLPLICYGYMSPSGADNPGRNGQSVFAPENGGIYILCLLAVLALAVLVRVISDRKRFFSRRYELLPGIVLLGAAYMLGGLGSPAWPDLALKNLAFSALQLAALAVPYVLFSAGIRWEKTPNSYMAWTGFGAGLILLTEIVGVYCTGSVIVDGEILRDRIYTGWGIHNNLGGMLTLMIPFAFYLAARYRRGWVGSVAGAVFLLGIVLTCSRSAILVGTLIFLLCILLMVAGAKNRRSNIRALVLVIGSTVLLVAVFHKPLLRLFHGLLDMGMDPSHRDTFYIEGIKQFLKYPIFGGSFYPIDFSPWNWATESAVTGFLPPRWHNTVIQLIACFGAVGLAAYGFHRFQTVRLLLRRRTQEKTFIACSVLALCLVSLLDCHFFNIGPVLFYSSALAFAENCGREADASLPQINNNILGGTP